MDFFEVVSRRRSVRSYTKEAVPDVVIQKAIDAALGAPNSSNMQTWRIYWVKSSEKKAALVEACLNQGAARTAAELLVFTADPSSWKVSRDFILNSFGDSAPEPIKKYYGSLIPMTYAWRILAPFKWLLLNAIGIIRPMARGPVTGRDIQEVSVKSTALACENFMLAIAAQGFDTCPMEGFDKSRVARIIKSKSREVCVMVIAVGRRDENVKLFDRYQLPREAVFKTI